ncbi:MAG TPA: FHA domain-containing protein [Pyrinomonadaceae bacterium]|nr:FHA domain-containing protein [Pyrinomonadaceae bacterium]
MEATFLIIREDLQVDPVTIVAEGLLVGRLPTCELLLNHPSVSRLHAGITNAEGEYYIRNLRPGNPIMLNDARLEEYEALADGDVIGIGPFALNIHFLQGNLVIKVSLQIAATQVDAITRRETSGLWELPTTMGLELPSTPAEGGPAAPKKPPARKAKPAASSSKALDVFWGKRITAATKTIKPSPLFPLTGRPSGKAQSLWAPTTDLRRRWPASMMLWGAVPIALLSVAGALFYASAFAPAPISDAHTRATMILSPAVANHANAGACTSCHALRESMEAKCASCHATDAFVATVIQPHLNAGIGCVACHSEHRGVEFSAVAGALLSCAECHNDKNKSVYNGKTVSTPHGGTFGYPVINGEWKWTGLDTEELLQRKTTLKLERLPSDNEGQWRSKQFHAVHMYRVKAVGGLPGNKEGELSCSSCHNSFSPPDLVTPKTTCAKCHNGQTDPRAGRQVIAVDKPNCTSCHIQHRLDKRHWNPSLLVKR